MIAEQTPVPLTSNGNEYADFVRLCDDLRSGKVERINRATDLLKAFPSERVVEYLPRLWQQEESVRRQQSVVFASGMRYGKKFSAAAILVIYPGVFVVWRLGLTFPWYLYLLLFYIFLIALLLFRPVRISPPPHRRQQGAFDVLRHHRTPRVPELTGLWVDALDFGIGYAAPIYAALAALLPQYAASDAPSLDAYRQQVLLEEVRHFTKHLRKRTATLNDTEARFLAAAVQYLSVRHERQSDSTTLPALQQLALLSVGGDEAPNRRLVREIAAENVPVVTVGRQ